jgi:cytochrome c-type biogenesis protein CcmE
MNKRATYLFGTLLLLLFAGFAMASFRSAMTQYVPFEKALTSSRTVQVAGGLKKDSTQYDNEAGALLFVLEEPETGATLPISYHGVKPGNFEDAVSIVAIGRYDAPKATFAADKLLVKCPSKYQGSEVEEHTYE